MSDMPKFKLTTVPVATPAALGSTRLMAVTLVGGSAASSVEFKDAATDTGTVVYSINVPIATTLHVCLEEVGGIAFTTNIFCKPAGTGALVYAWSA